MIRTGFDGQASAKLGVQSADTAPAIVKPVAPVIKDLRPIRTMAFSSGLALFVQHGKAPL
jgi:hypothetical protein